MNEDMKPEHFLLEGATPRSPIIPPELDAQEEIASQKYHELRDAPAAVAVPVSKGTTTTVRPEGVRMKPARRFVPRFSNRYLDFSCKRGVDPLRPALVTTRLRRGA